MWMILAKTKSQWLKQYLKEQGGELTITLRTIVVN
jgi:hypothetical protein